MRIRVRKVALMVLAGVLVLGLVGLVWATETASSETGQDAMQNGSSVSTTSDTMASGSCQTKVPVCPQCPQVDGLLSLPVQ